MLTLAPPPSEHHDVLSSLLNAYIGDSKELQMSPTIKVGVLYLFLNYY